MSDTELILNRVDAWMAGLDAMLKQYGTVMWEATLRAVSYEGYADIARFFVFVMITGVLSFVTVRIARHPDFADSDWRQFTVLGTVVVGIGAAIIATATAVNVEGWMAAFDPVAGLASKLLTK